MLVKYVSENKYKLKKKKKVMCAIRVYWNTSTCPPFSQREQLPICFPGRRIPSKLGPSLIEEVAPLEDHILPFENG